MSEIVYAGFKGRQNNKSNTMTWISPQAYLGLIPFFHKLVSLPSLVPLFPEHLPINIFLFFSYGRFSTFFEYECVRL